MRESLRVKFGDLKNGMRYYSQYDWSGLTWLSGVGVMAGSIHDPPGKRGMAHVVEHLITCRSRKYQDPKRVNSLFWRYLGGPDDDRNIRIDRSSTFYGHLDLLRKGYMLNVFDVMASFVHPRRRIIDPELAMAEFAAVHNEYCLRGVDAIEMFLDDSMHGLMYEKNPAGNRIDCDLEDLKKMTVPDVRRFLRRYYVPKNMFVVVLGPPFREVKDLAEKYFGDLDVVTEPVLDYDHTDDLPELKDVKQLEIIREGIHQYHCGIGFPTEASSSLDAEAIDVLARIWEMRLERLRDENREFEGGVYRNPVEVSRSFTHGLIWARFATVSGEFEKYAEKAILEETKKLKTDLVGDEELEAAKGRMADVYTDAFRNTANNLAEMIIEAVCNGDKDLVRLHDFKNRLRKVTRHRLRDAANKYFTRHYARVLIRPA
jgi:predicted Zn-dependent peptidase